MFSNLKLAAKIGLGFAALVAIALALGSIAVFNMSAVKKTATELVTEVVPEVAVANDVERSALHTMYEMRGYAYTEEKAFLDRAMKDLDLVKGHLKTAKEHAAKFSLDELKKNAETAEAKTLEYEKLAEETVKKTDALTKEEVASQEAADRYMKECYAYLKSQDKKLEAEVGDVFAHFESANSKTGDVAAAAVADDKVPTEKKIDERIWKIATANDIVDVGNAVRIGTWHAIANRDPNEFKETMKTLEGVDSKLDALKAATKDDANLKQIEACRAAAKDYLGCMQRFLAGWLEREELGKRRGEVADAVLTAAMDTAKGGMDSTKASSEKAAAALAGASSTMIGGLAVATVVGIVLAVFLTISITRPINRIIEALSSGSEQVSAASGQVASASQQMAQGANEQASSLEETSSSLEEMASMTRQNSDNANQANATAKEASSLAETGVEAMRRMSEAIDRIKESAGQTAKIIKTIDEIAFQTNLLALNAAVEAARAGEAGKGFAVVAEEVRNLARRSAEAAKNTADLIEGAQKNAESGVNVTGEVAKHLNSIRENAGKVSTLIAEIAAASREQSQGLEQVTTAVSQMDKVVQQNAANAEESASAAEELSSQAQELNASVAQLVSLVNGSDAEAVMMQAGATRKHKGPAIRTTAHPAVTHTVHDKVHTVLSTHQDAAPAGSRKANANGNGNGRRQGAEQVIPLDDKDFKEFMAGREG